MTIGRAESGQLHYPTSDSSLECCCGWRPPSQERWRQQMRLEEHLRFPWVAADGNNQP